MKQLIHEDDVHRQSLLWPPQVNAGKLGKNPHTMACLPVMTQRCYKVAHVNTRLARCPILAREMIPNENTKFIAA